MSEMLEQYRREAIELGSDDWIARNGRVVYAQELALDILAEAERLEGETKRLEQALQQAEGMALPKNIKDLEIHGTYLVQRGVYPGDLIEGYGILPGSDAEMVLDLSELVGWDEIRQGEGSK